MNFYKIVAAASLMVGSVLTAKAGPVVIADSTNDYSGIEGLNGWQYGYYVDPSTNFYSGLYFYGDTMSGWWGFGASGFNSFAFLGPNSMAHPGLIYNSGSQAVSYDVVRQWTSDYIGNVLISGSLYKVDTNAPASQVIVGTILLNGAPIYQDMLAGNDGVGVSYSLNTTLKQGDVLDFVIGANQASSIGNDLTVFSTSLTTAAPEPQTLFLGGSLAIALLTRRGMLRPR